MADFKRAELLNALNQMNTFCQNCLQGMLDYEHKFQVFLVNQPSQKDYEKEFQKIYKEAMISTYTLLFVQNLFTEKLLELHELETKNVGKVGEEKSETEETASRD